MTASSSSVHAGDDLSDRATPLSGTQLSGQPCFRTTRQIDSTAWPVALLSWHGVDEAHDQRLAGGSSSPTKKVVAPRSISTS